MKLRVLIIFLITVICWNARAMAQWTVIHFQDFEDSLGGWTHTNGQAFPAGWDRQPSSLHTAPPDPGSWCLWIDSDANMGGGAIDTALSPALSCDSLAAIKVVWGIAYDDYYSGADYSAMLYQPFTGGAWQAWSTGRTYAADAVKTDSLLIAPPRDSVRIGFCYDDAGTWAGWCAIDNVTVMQQPSGIAGQPPLASRLDHVELLPNWPNPVSGSTTFRFSLPQARAYSLKVYDITGRLVQSFSGTGKTGPNRVNWSTGTTVPGVYFCQLLSGSQSSTRKLVVVK